MSIVERTGFEPNHVKVIKKAFLFLKQKIQQFGENKKEMVDTSHHAVIDKEIKNVIDRIVWAEDWLKIEGMKFSYRMGKKPFQNMMNVIRSALELYLKDTKEAKNKSNIASFDSKIGDITKVISLPAIQEGNPNIYDKYLELEPKEEEKRIFLSYSHDDRVLAGKIADFLREKGIYVFLAHKDIEISDEWRDEIHKNLRDCNVLLALLTPSFKESVWTNQEAGYIMGRERKIVPLIVGKTKIKDFGFLETLQGIKVKEEKPELSFEEILNTVVK